jgi:hypothetical protein
MTSELLAAAAAYMSEHGHTKNVSVNEHGQVCMSGAIDAAAIGMYRTNHHRSMLHEITNALDAVARTISPDLDEWAKWPDPRTIVVAYNDRDDTSAEDAILMLKRAAAAE